MERLTRRQLLAAVTAGGSLALAGCATPADGGSPTEPDGVSPTAARTEPPSPPIGTTTAAATEETPHSTETTTNEPGDVPDVIFVDGETRNAIIRRLEENDQPWHTAFQQLRSDAEDALGARPKSVVDNGAPAGVDDPHRFGTDAPYQGQDGVFSDDVNRGDYFAALHMGNWIRDLTMAYGFSGRDEYAEKAVDLLHHWFVDPEVRMFPSAVNYGPHKEDYNGQNSIEHYITIPKMLYGASYVRGHPRWSTKPEGAESALEQWVRDYLADTESGGHRGGPGGNDIYKWWVVNRAVAAAYLGDTEALSRCFSDWRTTAFKDFERRGTFKLARIRTRGLYYSFSALNALVTTAEVGRQFGVDLYGHEVNGVNRLRGALEYHAPFLQDPSEWPWQELGGLERFERRFGGVSYEMAYSHWNDELFYDAIRGARRPIYDQRVLGWLTLSHGNLFELEV